MSNYPVISYGGEELHCDAMLMMFAFWDFFKTSSLKRQSADRYATHCRDFKSKSICSYSLKLLAYRRSNKYIYHNLWFNPTSAWTYDLSHARQQGSNLQSSITLEDSMPTITPCDLPCCLYLPESSYTFEHKRHIPMLFPYSIGWTSISSTLKINDNYWKSTYNIV